jgi:hypothetical protein
VRPYVGPLVLAVLALFLMAASTYVTRPRTLIRRAPDQLEGLRTAFSSRMWAAALLVLPAYATYALLLSTWTGGEATWAWLGCLALQVVGVYVALRSRQTFFALTRLEPDPPSEQDVLRWRFTRLHLVAAFASFYAARILLPDGGSGVPLWRGVLAASLMVVALLGFLAAGWTTVWVFRQRKSPEIP